MLSTSSLQAFSGATTTAPVSRPNGSEPIRLVRAQPDQAARDAGQGVTALPATRPGVPPPRGSLLNLSV